MKKNRIRDIACPKCGAEAGRNCFRSDGGWQAFCRERTLSVPLSPACLKAIASDPFKAGSNPTRRCGANNHAYCAGRHPRSHGMSGLPCTCSCHHREKRAAAGAIVNDEEAVRTIEPRALTTQLENGMWIVRRSPAGVILGHGPKKARAWHEARTRLFSETIGNIISEIPVIEK